MLESALGILKEFGIAAALGIVITILSTGQLPGLDQYGMTILFFLSTSVFFVIGTILCFIFDCHRKTEKEPE